MEKKATRDALGAEVLALGLEHKDVFVIDCDVAKSCKTLEFAAKLPEQHINVGISEQNAVGIAAGLATTGKVPFVVTYAIFGSMRAVEQIRQETCYTKLNVKILCSHGGLTPANDGASHQCRRHGNLKNNPEHDCYYAGRLQFCKKTDCSSL